MPVILREGGPLGLELYSLVRSLRRVAEFEFRESVLVFFLSGDELGVGVS